MQQCSIIIPTSSNYLDICDVFLALFHINWQDCTYPVILSVQGDAESLKRISAANINGVHIVINDSKASLPQCVKNAAKQYPSSFYCVMLGDAFITNTVCNRTICKMVQELNQLHVDYCSLWPKKPQKAVKKAGSLCRYIWSEERYAHTFMAFIASMEFINQEFSTETTDLDFEMKYLDISCNSCARYMTHAIANQNILHIRPGITKGKWDRHVARFLKRHYPDIFLSEREYQPLNMQIIYDLRDRLQYVLPPYLRRLCKKVVNKKNVFVSRS